MAVELRNIVKSFGATTVLAGTSLAIAEGEFMVLVGPSGCGKSTLLRVLAGLEEVDEGEVLIDGARVNDLAPAKRGVAMVFQSYALYPHMDVRRNMAFGLKLAGDPKGEIEAKVDQAAELLGITHLLERKPKALSGGQRQRVAIGRAIVRQPKVFLFDEPLSNLDAELRVRMRYEFAKLHQRLRTTTVYVTHDQVEAMTLADRIAVMDRGHVVQIGTPDALYERPDTLFVAGFIGSPKMNLLPGTVAALGPGGVDVRLRDGTVLRAAVEPEGLETGATVTIGIRPEHLRLAPDGVPAQVTLVESLGNIRFAYLGSQVADDPLIVQLSATDRVKEQDATAVAADPADCHLFDSEGAACRRLGRSPGSLAA